METLTGEEAVKRIRREDPSLAGITIEGNLDLGGVIIKYLYLAGTIIEGYLNLEKATIEEDLYLAGATIERNLYLEGTTVEGKLDMKGINVDKIYANGTLALAAHISIQSGIITSPSKLFPAVDIPSRPFPYS